MGKNKPPAAKKPKAAGSSSGGTRPSRVVGVLGGGCALCGALLWAAKAHLSPAATATHAGARFAAPFPDPAYGRDACDAIRPLWGNLSCDEFLERHWEASPRLARPGPAWARRLMTRPEVATMIGMWPFRIHKNHATVGFHVPDSGFLHDERWKRNDSVPTNAVDVALEYQRTLVMHNLEVYWAPIGRLTEQLITFFCSYTQVNFYGSPPGLKTATAPHQDAHSVFIVQLHGSKRWAVHRPRDELTLKAMQRGKRGELLTPGDARHMGPALVEATLTPGSVLYVPRAHYHWTSTSPEALAAPDAALDEAFGVGEAAAARAAEPDGSHPIDGEPSLALTLSILNEDVHCSWVMLLGEAAAKMAGGGAAVEIMRRRAATPSAESEGAVSTQLREGLPRALLAPLAAGATGNFGVAGAPWEGWRRHAEQLLRATLAAEDVTPPPWMSAEAGGGLAAGGAYARELDAVLARKRIPAALKLRQIGASLEAMAAMERDPGYTPDIDGIFRIEKSDRSYLPEDRAWFNPNSWR